MSRRKTHRNGWLAGRAGLLMLGVSIVSGSAVATDRGAGAEAPPIPDADRALIGRELEALKTADAAALTPDEALDPRHVGKRVRWAGAVYTISGRCLTINYARSGDYGEPHWTREPTYQSFVACGQGVYDADLVRPYTNVTIIGRITGRQFIGMGGSGSDGPAISVEKLYRWSDCLAGDDSPTCRQGFLPARPAAED